MVKRRHVGGTFLLVLLDIVCFCWCQFLNGPQRNPFETIKNFQTIPNIPRFRGNIPLGNFQRNNLRFQQQYRNQRLLDRREVAEGLDNDNAGGNGVQSQFPNTGFCKDGWTEASLNGVAICVRVNTEPSSWEDAQDKCRQDYSFLLNLEVPITVQSKPIQDHLLSLGIKNVWTGLHSEHQRLVWDDISPSLVNGQSRSVNSPWIWNKNFTDNDDVCGEIDIQDNSHVIETKRRKRSLSDFEKRLNNKQNFQQFQNIFPQSQPTPSSKEVTENNVQREISQQNFQDQLQFLNNAQRMRNMNQRLQNFGMNQNIQNMQANLLRHQLQNNNYHNRNFANNDQMNRYHNRQTAIRPVGNEKFLQMVNMFKTGANQMQTENQFANIINNPNVDLSAQNLEHNGATTMIPSEDRDKKKDKLPSFGDLFNKPKQSDDDDSKNKMENLQKMLTTTANFQFNMDKDNKDVRPTLNPMFIGSNKESRSGIDNKNSQTDDEKKQPTLTEILEKTISEDKFKMETDESKNAQINFNFGNNEKESDKMFLGPPIVGTTPSSKMDDNKEDIYDDKSKQNIDEIKPSVLLQNPITIPEIDKVKEIKNDENKQTDFKTTSTNLGKIDKNPSNTLQGLQIMMDAAKDEKQLNVQKIEAAIADINAALNDENTPVDTEPTLAKVMESVEGTKSDDQNKESLNPVASEDDKLLTFLENIGDNLNTNSDPKKIDDFKEKLQKELQEPETKESNLPHKGLMIPPFEEESTKDKVKDDKKTEEKAVQNSFINEQIGVQNILASLQKMSNSNPVGDVEDLMLPGSVVQSVMSNQGGGTTIGLRSSVKPTENTDDTNVPNDELQTDDTSELLVPDPSSMNGLAVMLPDLGSIAEKISTTTEKLELDDNKEKEVKPENVVPLMQTENNLHLENTQSSVEPEGLTDDSPNNDREKIDTLPNIEFNNVLTTEEVKQFTNEDKQDDAAEISKLSSNAVNLEEDDVMTDGDNAMPALSGKIVNLPPNEATSNLPANSGWAGLGLNTIQSVSEDKVEIGNDTQEREMPPAITDISEMKDAIENIAENVAENVDDIKDVGDMEEKIVEPQTEVSDEVSNKDSATPLVSSILEESSDDRKNVEPSKADIIEKLSDNIEESKKSIESIVPSYEDNLSPFKTESDAIEDVKESISDISDNISDNIEASIKPTAEVLEEIKDQNIIIPPSINENSDMINEAVEKITESLEEINSLNENDQGDDAINPNLLTVLPNVVGSSLPELTNSIPVFTEDTIEASRDAVEEMREIVDSENENTPLLTTVSSLGDAIEETETNDVMEDNLNALEGDDNAQIDDVVDDTNERIEDTLDEIKERVDESTEAVAENAENVAKALSEGVEEALDKNTDDVDDFTDLISENNDDTQNKIIENAIDDITDNVEDIEGDVLETKSDQVEDVIENINEAAKDIKDIEIPEIVEETNDIVKDLQDSHRDHIKEVVEEMTDNSEDVNEMVNENIYDREEDGSILDLDNKDSFIDDESLNENIEKFSEGVSENAEDVNEKIIENISDGREDGYILDLDNKDSFIDGDSQNEHIEKFSEGVSENAEDVNEKIIENISDGREDGYILDLDNKDLFIDDEVRKENIEKFIEGVAESVDVNENISDGKDDDNILDWENKDLFVDDELHEKVAEAHEAIPEILEESMSDSGENIFSTEKEDGGISEENLFENSMESKNKPAEISSDEELISESSEQLNTTNNFVDDFDNSVEESENNAKEVLSDESSTETTGDEPTFNITDDIGKDSGEIIDSDLFDMAQDFLVSEAAAQEDAIHLPENQDLDYTRNADDFPDGDFEEFVPPEDIVEQIPRRVPTTPVPSQKKVIMRLDGCETSKPSVCFTQPVKVDAEVSMCGLGWYGNVFVDKCYRYISQPMTFEFAQNICFQEGGQVANADTSFLRRFILTAVTLARYNAKIQNNIVNVWINSESGSSNCRLLNSLGIQNVNCATVAEVVCERPKQRKATESSKEDDSTDHHIEYVQPEIKQFPITNPDNKLECPLIRESTELPVLWYKDGVPLKPKLTRISSSIVFPSLVAITPSLTSDLYLNTDIIPQISVWNLNATLEVIQGRYWCEIWKTNPFRRLESKPTLVRFSDVMAFVGFVDTNPASAYDRTMYNMVNEPLAQVASLVKDLQILHENSLNNIKSIVPEVHQITVLPNNIQKGPPQKLKFYTYVTMTTPYTMATERSVNLLMIRELKENLQNTSFVLSLPGRTPLHLIRSLQLYSTVACAMARLKDNDTNLVATFPGSATGLEVTSVETCDGEVAGKAKCEGNFETGARWTDIKVYKSCSDDTTSDDSNDDNDDIDEANAQEQNSLEARLKELAEVDVEDNNADSVMEETADIIETANEITAEYVDYVADIVDKTADVNEASKEISENIVKTVDRLLNIDDDEMKKTKKANSIIFNLEKVAEKMALDAYGQFRIVRPNVALEVWDLRYQPLPVIGLAAKDDQKNTNVFDDSQIITLYNRSQVFVDDVNAAIELPPELVSEVMTEGKSRLYMMVYRHGRLFHTMTEAQIGLQENKDAQFVDDSGKLNSFVISASIGGKKIEHLENHVKAIFKPLKDVGNKEKTCAHWDFSLNNNRGGWSARGCTYNGTVNGRDICLCNHLTNFAVLIDFYGQAEPIPEDHEISLSIISLIGLSLSILGLSLTIISYAFFKKLRRGRAQQTLFNLALAMLCSWIVFLTGIKQTHSYYGCIIVAALLHYFILASFMWMLMEAFLQYLTFVKVLGTYVTRFTLKTVMIAWGLPLIPVICVSSIDYTLYSGGSRYCWMSLTAFYYSFAIPVGVIILCNLIVFVITVFSIFRRPTGLRTNQSKSKMAMANLQAAITSFVLLGLTWFLGYLAISDARLPFQYAFTILNSMQGFFIFVLFVIRKKRVRDQWLILCCCKSMEREKALRSLSASGSIPSTGSGRSSYSGRSERSDSTRTTTSFVNDSYDSLFFPFKSSRPTLYYRDKSNSVSSET